MQVKPLTWQQSLKDMITSTEALLAHVGLNIHDFKGINTQLTNFPIRVTHAFANKIKKGDPNDPLLKQVLPMAAENHAVAGFINDPLGEMHANKLPGLLHKYQGRVLLITNEACAIHCRYCFRKTFDYATNRQSKQAWHTVFAYIQADMSIEEVILSGGDPLVLSDSTLAYFIDNIAKICHVKTLRIHTRIPMVLPERITSSLINVLTKTHLKVVMVVHCNHPQEIDSDVIKALAICHHHDITLFNQAVLLKGINDNALTQILLSKRLFEHHVIPYYLHLNDKVTGNCHFDVSEADAVTMLLAMQAKLPGYLVPRLIKEEPGKKAKTVVNLMAE